MLAEPVLTNSGPVLGITASGFDGVTIYRGIPFAADTGGPNRWKLPQAPTPWTETRLCDKFGSICPQSGPPMPNLTQSEDCLSLNIWTPAASHDEKLPVYVWIYGGRFIFGSGSDPTFDGAYLASQGIVVVTVNYRLGVFGFLAHPELSAESLDNASGNYGIHDQRFALRWVQDNISAFGGDPKTVTIGGQSAGSASSTIHLYSPLSKGLFSRVIVESGMRDPSDPLISALAPSYRTKSRAETQGVAYLVEKGVSSIDELRKTDVAELLNGNNRNDDLWGTPPFFRPCLDGHIFPRTYTATLQTGNHADVPVLTGHNRDEGGVYTDESFDHEDYTECTQAKYGPLLDRYNELYPVYDKKDVLEVWNTAARDASRITLNEWATKYARHAASTTYIYHFTQAPPPRKGVNPPGWGRPKSKGYTYNKGPMIGAFHGSELWYAFNNFYATKDREWTSDDRAVGQQMSRWWINFIQCGNVNGPASPDLNEQQNPQWPAAGTGKLMEIGVESKVTPLADSHEEAKVQFWKDHFARQLEW